MLSDGSVTVGPAAPRSWGLGSSIGKFVRKARWRWSSPEDPGRISIDLFEQPRDLGRRRRVFVAVPAVVAVTPERRSLAPAYAPTKPGDGASRPLGARTRAATALDARRASQRADRRPPPFAPVPRAPAAFRSASIRAAASRPARSQSSTSDTSRPMSTYAHPLSHASSPARAIAGSPRSPLIVSGGSSTSTTHRDRLCRGDRGPDSRWCDHGLKSSGGEALRFHRAGAAGAVDRDSRPVG